MALTLKKMITWTISFSKYTGLQQCWAVLRRTKETSPHIAARSDCQGKQQPSFSSWRSKWTKWRDLPLSLKQSVAWAVLDEVLFSRLFSTFSELVLTWVPVSWLWLISRSNNSLCRLGWVSDGDRGFNGFPISHFLYRLQVHNTQLGSRK